MEKKKRTSQGKISKQGKGGGPKPKYGIEEDRVYYLASIGCSQTDIAKFYGCSPDLIQKSYSESFAKGNEEGKQRLRILQWKAAEEGSASMLIWLGKQYLGQSDKVENTNKTVEPVQIIVKDAKTEKSLKNITGQKS